MFVGSACELGTRLGLTARSLSTMVTSADNLLVSTECNVASVLLQARIMRPDALIQNEMQRVHQQNIHADVKRVALNGSEKHADALIQMEEMETDLAGTEGLHRGHSPPS